MSLRTGTHLFLPILMVMAIMTRASFAADPAAEPLWPGGAPGAEKIKNEEKVEGRATTEGAAASNRAVSAVTVPTIAVYPAPGDKSSGIAVIICPGGGYARLSIDKEGHDIARWLNSIRVTGVVLKYRMPRPDLSGAGTPWPLLDAQRAVRIIRSRAKELTISPNKIGIMGFSAGGHLASTLATHFDAGQADAKDPVDRVSCRPDFATLIYPVVSLHAATVHAGSLAKLLGENPSPELIKAYSNDEQVTPQTPPTFVVHARDDRVKVENSLLFIEALKKAGVPVEAHLYDTGGHGFGLGVGKGEVADWPQRFKEWLDRLEPARRP